jgi:Histidine kinase/Y_Y_Y domain/Two component regulator propeller
MHNYTFPDKQGKPTRINRLCEDKKGRLWVGTGTGIFLFNKTTKKIERPAWMPSFTEGLNISSLLCDTKGDIWITSWRPNSLTFYNSAENKFQHYENYQVNNQPVFDSLSSISRISEDEKGNIWLASHTNEKITCYDRSSGQWKRYPFSPKKTFAVADNGFNSIYAYSSNEIWLSSDAGIGLTKYNYLQDSISSLTRKEGLLSDNINSICKGNNGSFFLVSTAGINLFEPATNEIRTLKLNDENINLSFAYHQYYDSLNHQLICGLNDRILFVKDSIWESAAAKQVTWIDNITVNNTPVHIDPLTKELSLRYFEKNITLSFASVSYATNASLSYAYKMEGADNDWIMASQAPTANYTNLSPGRYAFMVKARNQTGKWGPVNTSLQITIAPPFWQTWWFISICLALIILSVYGLFRRRVNAIHHEAQMKQTIAETKMTALRAQMNPHFIFNAMNSIQQFTLKNDVDNANLYLSKFSTLLRKVLHSSQQNFITLEEEMEQLKLYLDIEKLRLDGEFTYRVNAGEDIETDAIKIPGMLIQPFIENALKHGLAIKEGEKVLTIEFTLVSEHLLKCIITDNGIGRRKAMEFKQQQEKLLPYESKGIRLVEERLALLNKEKQHNLPVFEDLYDESGHPMGTSVSLEVPVLLPGL